MIYIKHIDTAGTITEAVSKLYKLKPEFVGHNGYLVAVENNKHLECFHCDRLPEGQTIRFIVKL